MSQGLRFPEINWRLNRGHRTHKGRMAWNYLTLILFECLRKRSRTLGGLHRRWPFGRRLQSKNKEQIRDKTTIPREEYLDVRQLKETNKRIMQRPEISEWMKAVEDERNIWRTNDLTKNVRMRENWAQNKLTIQSWAVEWRLCELSTNKSVWRESEYKIDSELKSDITSKGLEWTSVSRSSCILPELVKQTHIATKGLEWTSTGTSSGILP